jgi:hypothetical protein
MAIQISGCTVIDNDRNITNANNMCVGVVTMTGSSGDIETPGTITAGDIDVPPTPIAFNPANGATEIISNTTIAITFSQLVIKGTGNITLRDGSASGTVLQTIDVTSTSVTVSEAVVTITPNPIPALTNVFVVVDAGAFTGISGNKIINTYNFTMDSLTLGDAYEGGFLICCASSNYWIVAPSSSEVSRDWYSRGDANTRAQQVSGCTGWFIAGRETLQNPGYTCRTFWDSFSPTIYWSGTNIYGFGSPGNNACTVNFTNGSSGESSKHRTTHCVRAFRTVTY